MKDRLWIDDQIGENIEEDDQYDRSPVIVVGDEIHEMFVVLYLI